MGKILFVYRMIVVDILFRCEVIMHAMGSDKIVTIFLVNLSCLLKLCHSSLGCED